MGQKGGKKHGINKDDDDEYNDDNKEGQKGVRKHVIGQKYCKKCVMDEEDDDNDNDDNKEGQ